MSTNIHPHDPHQQHATETGPAKQSTMHKVKDKAINLVEKVTGKPVGTTNTTAGDPGQPHPDIQPNQPGQHLQHDPMHPQLHQRDQPKHAPGVGTAAAGGLGGGPGGGMAALASDYNAAPATKIDAHGNKVLDTMPASSIVSDPDPSAGKATRVKNDILHPDDPTRPHTERHVAKPEMTTTAHRAGDPDPSAGGMARTKNDIIHPNDPSRPHTDHHVAKPEMTTTRRPGDPDPSASGMTRAKNDIIHPNDPTRPHTERHVAEMTGGGSTVHPATAAIPMGAALAGAPPSTGMRGVAGAPIHQHPHHHDPTTTTTTRAVGTDAGPGHMPAKDIPATYHAGQIGGDARHTLASDTYDPQHHLHRQDRVQQEQMQKHLDTKPLPDKPMSHPRTEEYQHHQPPPPAAPGTITGAPVKGESAVPWYGQTHPSDIPEPVQPQHDVGSTDTTTTSSSTATSTVPSSVTGIDIEAPARTSAMHHASDTTAATSGGGGPTSTMPGSLPIGRHEPVAGHGDTSTTHPVGDRHEGL
ncbi:hypothetical protein BGZ73_003691 [Actinomortierella ambigua]|nr:hypothetical protein BGZ73_003691 [Actinomortierella ambigua]